MTWGRLIKDFIFWDKLFINFSTNIFWVQFIFYLGLLNAFQCYLKLISVHIITYEEWCADSIYAKSVGMKNAEVKLVDLIINLFWPILMNLLFYTNIYSGPFITHTETKLNRLEFNFINTLEHIMVISWNPIILL